MRRKNIAVIAFVAAFFPLIASAQVTVSINATPATAEVSKPITVTHSIAPASFSYADQIHLYDKTTNQLKDLQAVFGPATTNYFTIITPGSYEFRYYSGASNSIIGTSNTVTVALPVIDTSTMTFNATPATVGQNAVVSVTHTMPANAFSYSDQVQLFNTATNQMVDVQVSYGANGTNNFIMRTPGTYEFRYYSAIKNTIVRTSNQITVTAPVIDLTSVTLSATPATAITNSQIAVAHTIPAASFSYSDQVQLFNVATNQMTDVQVSYGPTGTNNFVIRNPGTYEFRYFSAIGNRVVKTSNQVTITNPVIDPSSFQISVSPTTQEAGKSVTVTYSIPPAAFSYADQIHAYDVTNNQLVVFRSLFSPNGTTNFTFRVPSTYEFRYYSGLQARVVATSSRLSVTVPNPGSFTLTASPSLLELGQDVNVSYAIPPAFWGFTDTINVINATTGQFVSAVPVSVTGGASSTKSITLNATGTYAFQYRSVAFGGAIVKTSNPVEVRYINLDRITNHPLRSGPIIAFGDSITFGRDASTPANNYVSLLSTRFNMPITNAGVSGDTTAEALARLDTDVISKHPKLVIILLGGNDFLQKVPSATTFANIRTIVNRIHADGSAVLLVGIRSFFFADYDAQFRTIAFDTGAAYIPDALQGIIGNPFITTDLVHPKDVGHQLIADRLTPYISLLLQ